MFLPVQWGQCSHWGHGAEGQVHSMWRACGGGPCITWDPQMKAMADFRTESRDSPALLTCEPALRAHLCAQGSIYAGWESQGPGQVGLAGWGWAPCGHLATAPCVSVGLTQKQTPMSLIFEKMVIDLFLAAAIFQAKLQLGQSAPDLLLVKCAEPSASRPCPLLPLVLCVHMAKAVSL